MGVTVEVWVCVMVVEGVTVAVAATSTVLVAVFVMVTVEVVVGVGMFKHEQAVLMIGDASLPIAAGRLTVTVARFASPTVAWLGPGVLVGIPYKVTTSRSTTSRFCAGTQAAVTVAKLYLVRSL